MARRLQFARRPPPLRCADANDQARCTAAASAASRRRPPSTLSFSCCTRRCGTACRKLQGDAEAPRRWLAGVCHASRADCRRSDGARRACISGPCPVRAAAASRTLDLIPDSGSITASQPSRTKLEGKKIGGPRWSRRWARWGLPAGGLAVLHTVSARYKNLVPRSRPKQTAAAKRIAGYPGGQVGVEGCEAMIVTSAARSWRHGRRPEIPVWASYPTVPALL